MQIKLLIRPDTTPTSIALKQYTGLLGGVILSTLKSVVKPKKRLEIGYDLLEK